MSRETTPIKFKYMRRWYEFLRTLELGGGTIIILLFLIILFLTLSAFQVTEAARFLDMVIGALLMHLKSNLSHSELKKETDSIENESNETKPKLL